MWLKYGAAFVLGLGLSNGAVAGEFLSSLDGIYFGFKGGVPAEKQNVPINTKEFFVDIPTSLKTESTAFGVESSVAQLNVNEGKGYNYGFGLTSSTRVLDSFGKVSVNIRGKLHYLTKYDFGRKNYGGPLQASYAVGFSTSLNQAVKVGYDWWHMSNGDRYELNPALETHTLYMSFHI